MNGLNLPLDTRSNAERDDRHGMPVAQSDNLGDLFRGFGKENPAGCGGWMPGFTMAVMLKDGIALCKLRRKKFPNLFECRFK